MSRVRELPKLTGLRFVAALYVFVFHIRWPLVESKFLANTLGQGAIGMSLFFMLSGFFSACRYAGDMAYIKSCAEIDLFFKSVSDRLVGR